MALVYTKTSSGRKKPSAKTLRLREERKTYFKSILKNSDKIRSINLPESLEEKKRLPLSNAVGNGFKRSVDDYKWKRGCEESAATIKEIEKKKTRIAPVANKTGYQYITDGADVETLGRKV
jgi:restriction endonuclease S subunit